MRERSEGLRREGPTSLKSDSRHDFLLDLPDFEVLVIASVPTVPASLGIESEAMLVSESVSRAPVWTFLLATVEEACDASAFHHGPNDLPMATPTLIMTAKSPPTRNAKNTTFAHRLLIRRGPGDSDPPSAVTVSTLPSPMVEGMIVSSMPSSKPSIAADLCVHFLRKYKFDLPISEWEKAEMVDPTLLGDRPASRDLPMYLELMRRAGSRAHPFGFLRSSSSLRLATTKLSLVFFFKHEKLESGEGKERKTKEKCSANENEMKELLEWTALL